MKNLLIIIGKDRGETGQADVELLIEYVYFLSFMSNICTLLVFLCRKILSLHKI